VIDHLVLSLGPRPKRDTRSDRGQAVLRCHRRGASRILEARVLAAFVDQDERLKEIPASRRKRAVILRWLMRMFESDRRYPESEINAYLKSRHWDWATLRRELVGHRMLVRDAGIYWRLPPSQWRDETIEP
jgi:hypothetical protein